MKFQRGATFDHLPRSSYWFLDIGIKERSGCRGFSVSSPQLWNLLTVNIRHLHNEYQLFRKRLKTSAHFQAFPSFLCFLSLSFFSFLLFPSLWRPFGYQGALSCSLLSLCLNPALIWPDHGCLGNAWRLSAPPTGFGADIQAVLKLIGGTGGLIPHFLI